MCNAKSHACVLLGRNESRIQVGANNNKTEWKQKWYILLSIRLVCVCVCGIVRRRNNKLQEHWHTVADRADAAWFCACNLIFYVALRFIYAFFSSYFGRFYDLKRWQFERCRSFPAVSYPCQRILNNSILFCRTEAFCANGICWTRQFQWFLYGVSYKFYLELEISVRTENNKHCACS